MNRMIKVTVILLLSLCLTATALADAWICPLCGNINNDNFCPKDAQPSPVPSTSQVQVSTGLGVFSHPGEALQRDWQESTVIRSDEYVSFMVRVTNTGDRDQSYESAYFRVDDGEKLVWAGLQLKSGESKVCHIFYDNTQKFCIGQHRYDFYINDALVCSATMTIPAIVTPTPSPTPTPTLPPTPTPKPAPKKYTDEASFLRSIPSIRSYQAGPSLCTIFFDQVIPAGTKLRLSYYDKNNSYQSVSSEANGYDTKYSFSTGTDWKKEKRIGLSLQYPYEQAVLQFKDCELVTGFFEVTYERAEHSISFYRDRITISANGLASTKEPVRRLTYVKSDPSRVELARFDQYGKTIATITLDQSGKVFSVMEIDKDGNHHSLYATKGADLSTHQDYADRNLPSWKNGNRLIPLYHKPTPTPTLTPTPMPTPTPTPWAPHYDYVIYSYEDLLNALYEQAYSLQKEFAVYVPNKSLYNALLNSNLTLEAGLSVGNYGLSYSYYTDEQYQVIIYHFGEYTAGFRIAWAWASNDLSILTTRERQALQVAQQILNDINHSGLDELKLEKAIHDAIRRKTRYDYKAELSWGKLEDHGTAVGALLDGLCTCGGYADAFYLLCYMCGFNVRCMWVDMSKPSSHIMNMIQLSDGKWYIVDVCWDDTTSTNKYFNITASKAAKEHIWTWELFRERLAP